ncbi:winged helix-turn-helix transcriptional regulator [candidate division KSB1 bacterium]|nr:winged helix-turn-helix transcriptional regulator [candidate division KSB1 bacterium]
MRTLTKIFKALSDSNRLRILAILKIRPLCVCEITDVLQLANSTVSKHLSILRDIDLIIDKKQGKWVYYSLNTDSGKEINQEIMDVLNLAFHENEQVAKDAEKINQIDRFTLCKIDTNTD